MATTLTLRVRPGTGGDVTTLVPLSYEQGDDNFLSLKANKAELVSPAFTGTPTAPTAAPGVATTQLATTEFVSTGLATGLATKAPLASPALTGTPTAPTASAGTSSTQIASTAFVNTAVSNSAATLNNTIADSAMAMAIALG